MRTALTKGLGCPVCGDRTHGDGHVCHHCVPELHRRLAWLVCGVCGKRSGAPLKLVGKTFRCMFCRQIQTFKLVEYGDSPRPIPPPSVQPATGMLCRECGVNRVPVGPDIVSVRCWKCVQKGQENLEKRLKEQSHEREEPKSVRIRIDRKAVSRRALARIRGRNRQSP